MARIKPNDVYQTSGTRHMSNRSHQWQMVAAGFNGKKLIKIWMLVTEKSKLKQTKLDRC